MPEPITKQELIDASADASTIKQVVNDPPDVIVVSRLGRQYPTLATLGRLKQAYEDAIDDARNGVFPATAINVQQPFSNTVLRNQQQKNADMLTTKDFSTPEAAALAAYQSGAGLLCFVDTRLVVDQSLSPNLKQILEWAQFVQTAANAKFEVVLADGLHPVSTNIRLVGAVNLTSLNAATLIQITNYQFTSLGSNIYKVTATLTAALPAFVVVGYGVGVQCPQSSDKWALAAAGGHIITAIAPDRLSIEFQVRNVVSLLNPTLPLTNVTTYNLLANRLLVPSACIRAHEDGWDGAAIEGFVNIFDGGLLKLYGIALSYNGSSSDRDMLFASGVGSWGQLADNVVIAGTGECVLRSASGGMFTSFRSCLGTGTTGKEIWQGVHGCGATFTRCSVSLGTVTGITATISSNGNLSQCFMVGGEGAPLRTTYDTSGIEIVTSTLAFCASAGSATRGNIGFGSNTIIHGCPTQFIISAGIISGNPTITDTTGAVVAANVAPNVTLSQGGAWVRDLAPVANGKDQYIGTYTQSVDFGSIASLAGQDITVTAAGVLFNDKVEFVRNNSAIPNQGVIFDAFVSANDQITLRARNVSGAAVDPTAFTARFYVYRVT